MGQTVQIVSGLNSLMKQNNCCSVSLGCRPFYALRFGARAAEVELGLRIFDEPLVEIVAYFLAFHADEINAVDVFVDFFPIEHPAFKFLYPNAQKLFVISLDLEPASLIAGKILIVYLFVVGGAWGRQKGGR